jgi:hypothetical protein
MISKDIIVLENGKLNINKYLNTNKIQTQIKQLDISNFIPTIENVVDEESLDQTSSNTELIQQSLQMSPEWLSYLRLFMLIKMFKYNSTTVFPLNTLMTRLSEQITKYSTESKLNDELVQIFNDLTNVSDKQLIVELKSLEKRDIIEEVNNNSVSGYIYVV